MAYELSLIFGPATALNTSLNPFHLFILSSLDSCVIDGSIQSSNLAISL